MTDHLINPPLIGVPKPEPSYPPTEPTAYMKWLAAQAPPHGSLEHVTEAKKRLAAARDALESARSAFNDAERRYNEASREYMAKHWGFK